MDQSCQGTLLHAGAYSVFFLFLFLFLFLLLLLRSLFFPCLSAFANCQHSHLHAHTYTLSALPPSSAPVPFNILFPFLLLVTFFSLHSLHSEKPSPNKNSDTTDATERVTLFHTHALKHKTKRHNSKFIKKKSRYPSYPFFHFTKAHSLSAPVNTHTPSTSHPSSPTSISEVKSKTQGNIAKREKKFNSLCNSKLENNSWL